MHVAWSTNNQLVVELLAVLHFIIIYVIIYYNLYSNIIHYNDYYLLTISSLIKNELNNINELNYLIKLLLSIIASVGILFLAYAFMFCTCCAYSDDATVARKDAVKAAQEF